MDAPVKPKAMSVVGRFVNLPMKPPPSLTWDPDGWVTSTDVPSWLRRTGTSRSIPLAPTSVTYS